jgi:putative acetyltransferase
MRFSVPLCGTLNLGRPEHDDFCQRSILPREFLSAQGFLVSAPNNSFAMMNANLSLTIRHEKLGDEAAIRHVNEQAFHGSDEADLVEALRRAQACAVSLVAICDEQVVGHVLFSPVSVASDDASFPAVALGPMAVLPTHQNQGIGSELVRRGLEECQRLGHEVVFVLGHPNFYPRFGFAPTQRYNIRCEYDVPDEVFMVAELRAGALAGRTGIVKYRPEFSSV